MLQSGRQFELVFFVLTFLSVYAYISWSRRGKKFVFRRIIGLDAVKDLIGRATEMGGKIHYTPGGRSSLGGERAMDSIVGLSILGYVAKMAAENDIEITTTVGTPENQAIATAVVSQSNIAAGKPERAVDVRYYGSQFATSAGILGIIARENVGANIMIGNYGADAIILAEAAQTHGVMQIGGCAVPGNLPFFMAICDYYLMGEEMYAAAAISTGNPIDLAIIAAEDIPKWLIFLLVVIGVVATTAGSKVIQTLFRY